MAPFFAWHQDAYVSASCDSSRGRERAPVAEEGLLLERKDSARRLGGMASIPF